MSRYNHNGRARRSPIDPAKQVKGAVEAALNYHDPYHRREVKAYEIWVYEQMPTSMHPYYTKITLSGHNRFNKGQAKYEGPYGTWLIDLAPKHGWPSEKEMAAFNIDLLKLVCVRPWGSAHCVRPADQYHETPDERRVRIQQLIDQGLFSEEVRERWVKGG